MEPPHEATVEEAIKNPPTNVQDFIPRMPIWGWIVIAIVVLIIIVVLVYLLAKRNSDVETDDEDNGKPTETQNPKPTESMEQDMAAAQAKLAAEAAAAKPAVPITGGANDHSRELAMAKESAEATARFGGTGAAPANKAAIGAKTPFVAKPAAGDKAALAGAGGQRKPDEKFAPAAPSRKQNIDAMTMDELFYTREAALDFD